MSVSRSSPCTRAASSPAPMTRRGSSAPSAPIWLDDLEFGDHDVERDIPRSTLEVGDLLPRVGETHEQGSGCRGLLEAKRECPVVEATSRAETGAGAVEPHD